MVLNNAYLSLGSNLGDRLEYLGRALRMLGGKGGKVVRVSGIYESEPWKMSNGNNFLNQVILLQTPLKAPQLLNLIVEIEKSLGRTRTISGYEPRTIDIDILLYNDENINTAALIVPHPHLAARRFVLIPLCEVAPCLVHPVLKKGVKELLTECADLSEVRMAEIR